MNIALIDPSLFTLPYDVALARGLTEAGQTVTLHGRALTLQDGSAGEVPVEPSFYPLSAFNPVRRLPPPLRLAVKGVDHIASMLRLRRRLNRERPDIIHFQWLPLPALDLRFLPGLARIAPLVLTVHDTDPFNGNPTARLQSLGFVRALKAYDRLIVHTAQGMSRLVAQGVPASRITVLPHGPLAEAPSRPLEEPLAGPLTFVLFGKIKPYKGADLLVEAFARLPAPLRAKANIRIIGQAYMSLETLQARIARLDLPAQVTIEPRFVDDAEMPSIFPPGSVAVFPYREIEASGVLSLALAHGRPIIASRLGSFAETITDRTHGRLVPAGDVPALEEAMRSMIEDRALTARYAEAAYRLAVSTPGWLEIARRTASVYDEARAEFEHAQNKRISN